MKLKRDWYISAVLIAIGLATVTTISMAADTAKGIAGDAARGKNLYQGCESCHSIDENDVGPRHRGVVGRRAGSVSDYNYSEALKKSGITWNEQSLDRWLTNPSELVPGTKMFFKLDSAQDRADVIAYLTTLRDPQSTSALSH